MQNNSTELRNLSIYSMVNNFLGYCDEGSNSRNVIDMNVATEQPLYIITYSYSYDVHTVNLHECIWISSSQLVAARLIKEMNEQDHVE